MAAIIIRSEFGTANWLADRWNVSKRTLQKWRVEGRGPPYLKIGGCVRYSKTVIYKYEDRLTRLSTADRGDASLFERWEALRQRWESSRHYMRQSYSPEERHNQYDCDDDDDNDDRE